MGEHIALWGIERRISLQAAVHKLVRWVRQGHLPCTDTPAKLLIWRPLLASTGTQLKGELTARGGYRNYNNCSHIGCTWCTIDAGVDREDQAGNHGVAICRPFIVLDLGATAQELVEPVSISHPASWWTARASSIVISVKG